MEPGPMFVVFSSSSTLATLSHPKLGCSGALFDTGSGQRGNCYGGHDHTMLRWELRTRRYLP
jgi:hypothetical protein